MRNKRFWINLVLYLLLILGALHLYFPFTNDPLRQTRAVVEFVYEKF
jgi:hypothetical protein